MARGQVTKEALEKRIQKRVESRAALDAFIIKITDKLYVTIDKYNILLVERAKSQESGNEYDVSRGFYSTLQGVAGRLKDFTTEKEINEYLDRVKVIKTSYKDGLLKTKAPDGFLFDKMKELNV